jgi:NAD+ kinase
MSTKLLKTIISVNDNEFSDVYADGVIVSTPIGSSAYNLSAGGPLLATGSNCYVITPICPQSRTVTSIVLSKDDVTSLTIGENVNTERSDNVVVVDGYVKYPVNANDVVLIEKSNKSLQLVQFSKHKFLYESVYKTVVSINKKSSN